MEERLRLPRKGELFGVVIALQGGARMIVHCEDGKERMVRVPGSIKRQVWVKEGDVVLVEPWSVQGDEKGDIAYRYTRLQVEKLRNRGLLKLDF
ncbi:TPA: translation initiation factor eIF-1A [Candidatus Micrarchaeota archaeon]|nr:translation initiation factor eIF-1A [Candidatus Micrarchaeota archaeon]